MHTSTTRPAGATRRWLATAATATALATAGTLAATTEPASAWAWDGHVQVIASEHSCGISSTTGWGWFQADNGERGWITKGNSGSLVFDLYRVPGYRAATLVTIKWGVSTCQKSASRVISRPAYGTQVALGVLG